MAIEPRLYPVIMCGGSGTRLWPASRPSRPKQFLPLVASDSLFSATVRRVASSQLLERVVVVTGSAHASSVLRELDRLGIEADVLLEPMARDSGPAVAVAAHWIARRDPAGVAVILASDHHIPDTVGFRSSVEHAARAAESTGRIVTLGIKPATPSSAYGYIQPGALIEGGVRDVLAFVEKPQPKLAERYVADGYLWNSGNFIAPAGVLIEEIERFAPDIMASAAAGLAGASPRGGAVLLGKEFETAPKRSFDFAVMEHTRKAAVLSLDLAWSDLGAWDAVHASRDADDDGNSTVGTVVARNASGNLLQAAPGILLAVTGVSGLAVIAEQDAVLVTPLDRAQEVKDLRDRFDADRLSQADIPPPPPATLAQAAHEMQTWLFGAALPAWTTFGIDHSRGVMIDQLDQGGRCDPVNRRMRVQPRQAYAFARAKTLGWPGPSDYVVQVALQSLTRDFRRHDGLYRTLLQHDDSILDDNPVLYDQAFALLALAHTNGLKPDPEDEALVLLDRIQTTWLMANGGFRESGDLYLSNPLMHLFEATLAWTEVGQSSRWAELADTLAGLALTRLMDPASGFIGEHYGADWQIASGQEGARIEPGHQFEWAWLLVRYGRLRDHKAAVLAAERLYEAGLAGVDIARGVAVDAIDRDGRLLALTARLWPQTEWLKAALILLEEAEDPARKAIYLRDALNAVRAVKYYIPEHLRGLWYDRMAPSGQLEPGPSPASTLYHLVEAITQLVATAKTVP